MRLRRSRKEKDEIRRVLAQRLEERPEVLFANVFGSFLLNGPFGDIDVGVYLSADALRGREPMNAAFELADLLEKDVRLPVDVHIFNTTPLALKWEILRGEPLLARDRERRAEVIEQTTLTWWDTEGLRRAMIG